MKIFLLIALLFAGANIQAQERFYAKLLSGPNFLQNTTIDRNKSAYQTGYLISAAIGYNWCYDLRLEVEYAYRKNGIRNIHFMSEGSSNRGHLQTSSLMANVLWDVPCAGFWNVEPYIGAGLGYDWERMHATNSRINFNQKWHQFSWQTMAGFSYPVFCNTELSLEYRFHKGGQFYNHSIALGLAYEFGLCCLTW